MARKPNVRYDAQKLDAAIREIDGERYTATNVGTIVMGKGNTYYFNCLKKNLIAEDALDRVCKFYKLKKKEYLLPDESKIEVPAEPIPADTPVVPTTEPAQADPIKVIAELPEIDMNPIVEQLIVQNKLLTDQIAQQKSTNYLLEQVVDRLIKIKGSDESILKILQDREKKFQNKNNMKRIG